MNKSTIVSFALAAAAAFLLPELFVRSIPDPAPVRDPRFAATVKIKIASAIPSPRPSHRVPGAAEDITSGTEGPGLRRMSTVRSSSSESDRQPSPR